MLACDCHPWHGILHLSILKEEELRVNPALNTPEEMAAWEHFHFTNAFSFWPEEQCQKMKTLYDDAEDKSPVVEYFLLKCAELLAEASVSISLRRASNFRLCVAHPDTGYEFIV